MKKSLILLVVILSSFSLPAQSLYQLWEEAGKDMVKTEIYGNGFFIDGKEVDTVFFRQSNGRWSPPEGLDSLYRKTASDLENIGFDYNRQTDTLCFIFVHAGLSIPDKLYSIFIKNSTQSTPKKYNRHWRAKKLVEVPYEIDEREYAYYDNTVELIPINYLYDAIFNANTNLTYQLIKKDSETYKAKLVN